MTAIAGFVDRNRVWIGGDSAGVSGWSLMLRADQKVFKNGEFVFGCTTSFRMAQLLKYCFSPPVLHEAVDPYEYMVKNFVGAARECFKDAGFATRDKEQESGGVFLVGIKARLFRIDSDYQVIESAAGYDAVGCGADLAIGALFATKLMEPTKRMQTALEAAEAHSAGVRGPFHVEISELV